jgi:hypothetical protein
VIPKIGLRLTFQPLRVFLNFDRAIIEATITATTILILVGEDTYDQAVTRGVNNHFIPHHPIHAIVACPDLTQFEYLWRYVLVG